MKRIYKNWSVHNIVAHPLMQVLHLVGLPTLGDLLHAATLPQSPSQKEQA